VFEAGDGVSEGAGTRAIRGEDRLEEGARDSVEGVRPPLTPRGLRAIEPGADRSDEEVGVAIAAQVRYLRDRCAEGPCLFFIRGGELAEEDARGPAEDVGAAGLVGAPPG